VTHPLRRPFRRSLSRPLLLSQHDGRLTQYRRLRRQSDPSHTLSIGPLPGRVKSPKAILLPSSAVPPALTPSLLEPFLPLTYYCATAVAAKPSLNAPARTYCGRMAKSPFAFR